MIHLTRGLLILPALWLPQIAGAANPAPRFTPDTQKTAHSSPKPAPQRPGIVVQRTGGTKAVTLNPVILPGAETSHSEGPTYFALERKGNQAFLVFHSSDPHLKLSTQTGFLIQILPPGGVQVAPKLLRASDWPPGKLELPIQITGRAPTQNPWVQGSAAYLVCDDRIADATKRCQRTLATFAFKP